MALPRNQQSIMVIDLRGEDRAAGTIAGARPIPALEFLKAWCAEFKGKPILCPQGTHGGKSVQKDLSAYPKSGSYRRRIQRVGSTEASSSEPKPSMTTLH